MIPNRRHARKWTDRDRYMVSALYLHGLSESQIAERMCRAGLARMSKGVVSGIINQTPFRGLTNAERQQHLDVLAAHRMDGGRLEDFVFRASSKDGRGGR